MSVASRLRKLEQQAKEAGIGQCPQCQNGLFPHWTIIFSLEPGKEPRPQEDPPTAVYDRNLRCRRCGQECLNHHQIRIVTPFTCPEAFMDQEVVEGDPLAALNNTHSVGPVEE